VPYLRILEVLLEGVDRRERELVAQNEFEQLGLGLVAGHLRQLADQLPGAEPRRRLIDSRVGSDLCTLRSDRFRRRNFLPPVPVAGLSGSSVPL
jgi:hypothetical protein